MFCLSHLLRGGIDRCLVVVGADGDVPLPDAGGRGLRGLIVVQPPLPAAHGVPATEIAAAAAVGGFVSVAMMGMVVVMVPVFPLALLVLEVAAAVRFAAVELLGRCGCCSGGGGKPWTDRRYDGKAGEGRDHLEL